MQSHYIELTAIPQAEILQSELLNVMVETIHHNLYEYQGRIALGFPAYVAHRSLGNIIRLYGNKEDISSIFNKLESTDLVDYAIIKEPSQIPNNCHQFACFTRFRKKSPSGAELRRMEKRWQKNGKSKEEIAKYMQEWAARGDKFVPFVLIKSSSTKQKMHLYIEKRGKTFAKDGIFNLYGLSKEEATVPIF